MLSDLHESFNDQNSWAFMRKIDASQEDHKELEDLAKKRESSVIWDMIESLESQKRCLGTEQTEKTERTPALRDGRRRETMKCFRQGQEIVFIPQTAVNRGKPKHSIVQEHLDTQYILGNGTPLNDQNEQDYQFDMLKVSKMAKFVGLFKRIKIIINKLTKNVRIWEKITSKELSCIGDLAAAEDQDVFNQESNQLKINKISTLGKTASQLRKYFMGNLFSSLSRVPVFLPFSGGKIIWDLIVLIAIVTVSFLFSLRVFFLLSFQHFSETLFSALWILILDMVIQFNTAFLDKGSLINTRQLIIIQYLKNDALFDLISLIPLVFVIPTFHIQEQFEVASLSLFICKWPQLKKIWQRFHFFLSYQRNQKNLADLLQLIFLIVSVCHIFCLFWHGLAIFEISLGKNNTWLHSYNLQDSDIFQRYIASFYYLATTMITVGYGDITPKNTIEIAFTVFTMFVTGTIWAFFLTSIASIFANIQRKDKKYNANMQVIHSLMREENVNASLRLKISNYLEYLYKESNEAVRNRENDIISKLSNQLRSDIIQDIRGKYLEEIPIMTKLKEKARLTQVMEECLFSPGECIFKEAQEDDFSLFYLIKGKVELTFSTKNTNREDTVIKTLEKKNYFGEISFITGQPRTLTARAKDFCRVYKFQRSKFLEVISHNPQDLENIAMMREQISMNSDFKLCNARCLLCSKDNHLAHNCPRSHLNKSMNVIAQRINYSVPHAQRLSFERKGFKFPTRKCLQDILDGVLDINNDEDLYDILDELERNLIGNYTEDLEKDFEDDLDDFDDYEEKKESVAQPECDSSPRPRSNLPMKFCNKINGIPEQHSPMSYQNKLTSQCKSSIYSQQSLQQEASKKDNCNQHIFEPIQLKKIYEDPQTNLHAQKQSNETSTFKTASSKTSKKQTTSNHSSSISSSSLDSSSSESSKKSQSLSSSSSSSSNSRATSSAKSIPENHKNEPEINFPLEQTKIDEQPNTIIKNDNIELNPQDLTIFKGVQTFDIQKDDGIRIPLLQLEENSKEEQSQAKPAVEKLKLQSQQKGENKDVNKIQSNILNKELNRYVSLGANKETCQLKGFSDLTNMLHFTQIDQHIEPKRSKQISMNSIGEINGLYLNNNNESKQCPPIGQPFGIVTRRQSQLNGERIRGITAHKAINPISLQEQIQVILEGIKLASNNLFSRMSQDRKDSKQLSQKFDKGARNSSKSVQDMNGIPAERRIRNQQEVFSTNQFREFNNQIETPGEVDYKMLLSFDLFKVFKYYFPRYNYLQVVERWQQDYLARYEMYLKKKKAAKKLKYRTEKSKRLLENSLLNP